MSTTSITANSNTPVFAISPPVCKVCRLRQSGAFTAIKPNDLVFIEGFRASNNRVSAGGTIMYEQTPNGKLFTLYSGWRSDTKR